MLCSKASNGEFDREELGFLGRRVLAAGVAIDSRKVAVVRDCPISPSYVALRRFEGFVQLIPPLRRRLRRNRRLGEP